MSHLGLNIVYWLSTVGAVLSKGAVHSKVLFDELCLCCCILLIFVSAGTLLFFLGLYSFWCLI